MADAIVHIGFNKCGSTAIQKWLATNQNELSENNLFFERTDPRPHVVCHNYLLYLLSNSLSADVTPAHGIHKPLRITSGDQGSQDRVAFAFKNKVEQQVKEMPEKTFIYSCEHLTARTLKQENISALVDWLRATFANVRAIAYIRQPGAWTVSKHGHETRASRTEESLTEYAKRIGSARYKTPLEFWTTALGASSVDVRLFQEEWLSGEGLIEDFAGTLNLKDQLAKSSGTLLNTGFAAKKNNAKSMLLIALGRRKQRPSLGNELSQFISSANADDMNWIEETYFSSDRDNFRGWLNATQ